MNQEIISLYDEYTHKPLPRREFLERLTRLVGGSAAVLALLPILENNYAKAEVIKESDGRLEMANESFAYKDSKINCYVAHPKGKKALGAVIVIHENRGLNPHIKDVARRIALEGFLAIAPDALSIDGGTPADEDKAREMIGKLASEDAQGVYMEAVQFAKNHKLSSKKVGVVGFCWGGGMANNLAAYSEGLDAVVSYYGMQPPTGIGMSIKAPLMLHYAGLDERINKGILNFVEELNAGGAPYTLHMYSGVNHAFNNDTNAARYDKKAAELSWKRTIAFLKENLS